MKKKNTSRGAWTFVPTTGEGVKSLLRIRGHDIEFIAAIYRHKYARLILEALRNHEETQGLIGRLRKRMKKRRRG